VKRLTAPGEEHELGEINGAMFGNIRGHPRAQLLHAL
jgi:hypothetical protein